MHPPILLIGNLFFETIHEFFFPCSSLIVGGDFNCYESTSDKFGGNVSIHSEYVDLKSDFRLVDVWRKRNPKARKFTWFNANFSFGSHLDKFLITKDLLPSVEKCDILPCPFSDHDCVLLAFDVPEGIKYGPGVWKLNNSLLDDEDFCDLIRKAISDHILVQSRYFDSICDWGSF